jgi:arylsulfatase A-like enzyme
VLIVAADHGEGFSKHPGVRFHNNALYEEVTHVPLLIRLPGVSGKRVETLVSTIDLGPTILDLYELPTPGTFMGQSLVPLLAGDEVSLTRPVVSSTLEDWAVAYYEPPLKVILDRRKDAVEVYNLAKDPDERDNIADDVSSDLQSRLRAFTQAHKVRK